MLVENRYLIHSHFENDDPPCESEFMGEPINNARAWS